MVINAGIVAAAGGGWQMVFWWRFDGIKLIGNKVTVT
jgi:hypothetical protein